MDIKNMLKVTFILFLCLIFYFTLCAQGKPGMIIGKITDEEGNPLPGVSVILKGPTIATRTTISSATGAYRFTSLPTGEYSITYELPGFKTKTIKSIIIQPEEKKRIDLIKMRFYMPRRIKPEPPKPSPPVKKEISMPIEEQKNIIKEEIEQLSIGMIMFNPTEEMTEHIRERIEVRISQNINEDLKQGLKGRGIPKVEEIKVSTVMTAKLCGDTFKITPLSDEEQPILSSGYTQWEWDVTPQKAGHRKLQLSVSASIDTERFGEKKKSYPVKEKVINVKVNPNIKKDRKIEWYKIIGGIGACVGAIAALFGIYFGFKQLKLAHKRRKE